MLYAPQGEWTVSGFKLQRTCDQVQPMARP